MAVAAQHERIRGPNLAVFITKRKGVLMEEAIQKADEAGLVIAPNRRLSKALVGSDEWKSIRKVFACWSGTMTAYDRPDRPLGDVIEYTEARNGIKYVFPVPKEHWGKKNVILVVEHPNFTLVKHGKERVVQATEVDAVENFPTSRMGWFHCDPKHGIPQGNKADSLNPDSRCLFRDKKRVGLAARDYGWLHNCKRDVLLFDWRYGVAVEAPNAEVAASISSGNWRAGKGDPPL